MDAVRATLVARGYYRSDEIKQKKLLTKENTYEKRKEYLKTYYAKHTERIQARRAVWAALKAGTIKRLSCNVCGNEKVEAHHYKGYSKANSLDITWLCIEHHNKQHHG